MPAWVEDCWVYDLDPTELHMGVRLPAPTKVLADMQALLEVFDLSDVQKDRLIWSHLNFLLQHSPGTTLCNTEERRG